MFSSLFALAGYLIGSVSSAVITCRAMGLPDPRQDGSGNPGATNVLRLGGKGAAAITLIGDLLKGLLPTAIAQALFADPAITAAAAAGAFLGHLFPLWFGFRGGKGVATAFGGLFGALPLAGLLAAATWLAVFLLTRLSSLSALLAFTAAPFYLWWLSGSTVLSGTFAALSALLLWRHRGNIKRLLGGREPRVGGD